jgi:hypothetical protein
MADYIFLMHDDAAGGAGLDWERYLSRLREAGVFQGGSAIGEGQCERKSGATPAPTAHITGFIRVTAADIAHARLLLAGNPVFEAGGTVEIRELPSG